MADTDGFASGARSADLLRPMPPMPPCTGCVELEKRVAAIASLLEWSLNPDNFAPDAAERLDAEAWGIRKDDKPEVSGQ